MFISTFPCFPQLTEYELCIASDLVDPLGMVVSWENIGGLEGTINEILETVILPFHDNAFVSDSSLVQPPKGKFVFFCRHMTKIHKQIILVCVSLARFNFIFSFVKLCIHKI